MFICTTPNFCTPNNWDFSEPSNSLDAFSRFEAHFHPFEYRQGYYYRIIEIRQDPLPFSRRTNQFFLSPSSIQEAEPPLVSAGASFLSMALTVLLARIVRVATERIPPESEALETSLRLHANPQLRALFEGLEPLNRHRLNNGLTALRELGVLNPERRNVNEPMYRFWEYIHATLEEATQRNDQEAAAQLATLLSAMGDREHLDFSRVSDACSLLSTSISHYQNLIRRGKIPTLVGLRQALESASTQVSHAENVSQRVVGNTLPAQEAIVDALTRMRDEPTNRGYEDAYNGLIQKIQNAEPIPDNLYDHTILRLTESLESRKRILTDLLDWAEGAEKESLEEQIRIIDQAIQSLNTHNPELWNERANANTVLQEAQERLSHAQRNLEEGSLPYLEGLQELRERVIVIRTFFMSLDQPITPTTAS